MRKRQFQHSANQEAHLKPCTGKRSETMKIKSELIKATVVVALAVLLINGNLASSPIRVGALQATTAATAASDGHAGLPLPMESPLVPCVPGVMAPCDMIATKPADIAGVWKQYFLDPFFKAPGGVAYIRFNADGTFNLGDSIENTAKPSQGYPSGTVLFDGQHFSFGPVTGAPPPCNIPPVYQMRVLKYGDKPVALRQVVIQDSCAARMLDVSQPLMWVAPSTQ
jgi:hypothetical protein